MRFYYMLMKRLNLYKEDLISADNWKRAYEFCKDVDETDILHVALTIQLDGLLSTGDKKVGEELVAKWFHRVFEPKQESST